MSPMKRARKRLGLTQQQAAKAGEVSQAHLCNVENGRERASPQLAEKLAGVLGIPEEQILYPERFPDE